MKDDAPARPILALTLALAGKRLITDSAHTDLIDALTLAFDAVTARMTSLGDMARRPGDPLEARFDASRAARLTLVTGLADGVDQIAGGLFLDSPASTHLERLLGAVLPCGRDDFLANSQVDDRVTFEDQFSRCAFVVELDGAMPPSPTRIVSADGKPKAPTRESAQAIRERSDAFTGQSEILLRQADILIAVDNPHEDGRAGGTRDTIQGALELGTPVVLIHLGEPGLALLRTRGDYDEPVMLPPGAAYQAVAQLVDDIVGIAQSPADEAYVAALVAQFFAEQAPKGGLLNALWNWFDARFNPAPVLARQFVGGRPGSTLPPAATPRMSPYDPFKERASELSAYYAGRYRGAFLAAYGLAVVAVAAAVLSLAILPLGAAKAPDHPFWWGCLFVLSCLKVWVVITIFLLADRANKEKLAHRAADYRYLSERLRAMTYLPKAACLRSPAPWSLPYTTRVSAQGVIDRLFAAIVREAEPLRVLEGAVDGKVIRPNAHEAMTTIREDWLNDQVGYHIRNQRKLKAMSRWLEGLGSRINKVVILVAITDVLVLLVEAISHPGGRLEEMLHSLVAPALIAFAAILPAAVASVNGIRFQSECTRLADRSLQMAQELSTLEARSWSVRSRPVRVIDALHLATDTARLTLDEVAEWSAIYGKEFIEM